MDREEGLRRLAIDTGIALEYDDIWGRPQAAKPQVLEALLRELGVLPEGADPESVLAERASARFRRVLPPVVVARTSALPVRVRVGLPSELEQEELRWRITEEQGEERSASFRLTDCAPLATRRLSEGRFVAGEVTLAVALDPGYHTLSIERDNERLAACPLIVAPDRTYVPPILADGARVFGPAVQLYAVRSERNWGIGDFTDLRALVDLWGERGADVIGLNPLHALFLGNPNHASPYSPSSRVLLNVLYTDVEAVPEFHECEPARAKARSPEFQTRVAALREAVLVDYGAIASAKREMLELLWRHFRERHIERASERAGAFAQFRTERGKRLEDYALFEALYEHLQAEDGNRWSWLDWPPEYRSPPSPAVRAFAAEHAERIGFFCYLQWLAHEQLDTVARRAAELDLGIGLYLDLAVSIDRGGADGWELAPLLAPGASVGAPPDEMNRKGQNWGLPPFVPERLREAGYAPLIEVFREGMHWGGALRIDHVMGLARLYWIPPGGSPAEGAYVHYDLDELLAIVALESVRNQCLVIGEDLGTVSDNVREGLSSIGALSYRPLLFERTAAGEFKPPADYPENALVAVTTHDLPTLAGFWSGHDLELRHRLSLFDADEVREAQVVGRSQDRARLLIALERERLLPEGATVNPVSIPHMTEPFSLAIHAFVARSRARVMMVQLEDVLGIVEQVNLPASGSDQYPNWRRKLTLALEAWPGHPPFGHLLDALRAGRGERPARRRRESRSTLRIPRATYRLQLNKTFGFRDATAIVPYLARLGVSHVYCSPYLKARPGSTHGYDIIDHNELNPEIGTTEEFEAFAAALKAHGMGQVADIVPNHMGVTGADNAWWLDVLENGPASVFAPYFDIDWYPPKPELAGKVLLPILGGNYGEVLERGEIRLTFDADRGAFHAQYFNHLLPIAPREYPRMLADRMEGLALRLGAEHRGVAELASLVTAFDKLPPRDVTDKRLILERHRDRELHKERLARLAREVPEIRRHIDDTVRAMNGAPGEPRSFDQLHDLLEAQPWRLADWRSASDDINYRRFFDINELAGLRMEDPRVFDATHGLILKLVAEGSIDGLRLDHPDGLFDPQRYFERLQERVAAVTGADVRQGREAIWLVVEKILASHEALPESWPVHGTTGYDFMNLANGVFVDPNGARRLERFFRALASLREPFDDMVHDAKRLILKHALAAELNVLAGMLARISEANRHTRDHTLNRLRQTLAEVVAYLPIYRTYVRDESPSAADRRYIDWAVTRAKKQTWAEDTRVFEFVRSALLGEPVGGAGEAERAMVLAFAMKFQQLTGPVMAKGYEDTILYRYPAVASAAEVGGDLRRIGLSARAFHGANQARARRWPHAMIATSTHDNKRSEDVRLRLAALTELAPEWRDRVKRWARLNRAKKRVVDDLPAPTPLDEYALYQALVGTWPVGGLPEAERESYCKRIEAYVLKAAREAKVSTSWINNHQEYEEALQAFVRNILEAGEQNLFEQDLAPFAERIAHIGVLSSLSLTLLKLTSPGVPDIYQGTELIDDSLVDPDNRRPVDFALRTRMLDAVAAAPADRAAFAQSLLDSLASGEAKLYLIQRVLAARANEEALFREGSYLPLKVEGTQGDRVIAYARRWQDRSAVVVAPRLAGGLVKSTGDALLGGETWGDTAIEPTVKSRPMRYEDVLTGRSVEIGPQGTIAVAKVLADFPVALLLAREERIG